jgi:hypothetical protein
MAKSSPNGLRMILLILFTSFNLSLLNLIYNRFSADTIIGVALPDSCDCGASGTPSSLANQQS